MNKFKTLLLLIGFLTFFGFSTNGGITKAAEISPMCLTCGGTVTSDYKITAQTRVYGPWKDAFQPLIYGGPSGGSKAYSESESYTSTIRGTDNQTEKLYVKTSNLDMTAKVPIMFVYGAASNDHSYSLKLAHFSPKTHSQKQSSID